MQGVYTIDEIRTAEQKVMAVVGDDALMQRAAAGLAAECVGLLNGRVYGARVVVLTGAGNNGGDALFAAAALARRGAQVTAVLLKPDKAHPGGLAALVRARGRSCPPDQAPIGGADLVLDGIVGIGGRAGLRDEAVALAEAARGVLTVAVDVPSGVDAGTGETGDHAIDADVTVTFGALKPGLLAGVGAQRSGEVRLVDIGLGDALPDPSCRVLEAADVAGLIAHPDATSNKYSRGVLGVVAGSEQYPGAGVLCTGSAIDGGAGMIRYAGTAVDAVRARYPEIVVSSGARPGDLHVQAWVVGPGMGTSDDSLDLLRDVLATDLPVIVDADAITLLAKNRALVEGRRAPTVLTPHDGEFARIADGPSADRIGSARKAARDLGATVLLKGNATVIAAPDGQAYVNPTGTPWLATAGSGDVLSGLVGSLLASGVDAPLAAATGAYVHGVAGQIAAAGGPPSAVDVLHAVRPALRSIQHG